MVIYQMNILLWVFSVFYFASDIHLRCLVSESRCSSHIFHPSQIYVLSFYYHINNITIATVNVVTPELIETTTCSNMMLQQSPHQASKNLISSGPRAAAEMPRIRSPPQNFPAILQIPSHTHTHTKNICSSTQVFSIKTLQTELLSLYSKEMMDKRTLVKLQRQYLKAISTDAFLREATTH